MIRMTAEEIRAKGVTLQSLTASMRRLERVIAFFNTKYEFDKERATAAELREWNTAQNTWDVLKVRRDTLKAAA